MVIVIDTDRQTVRSYASDGSICRGLVLPRDNRPLQLDIASTGKEDISLFFTDKEGRQALFRLYNGRGGVDWHDTDCLVGGGELEEHRATSQNSIKSYYRDKIGEFKSCL